jgi:transcriptional regulator with XRE-family HTH domain
LRIKQLWATTRSRDRRDGFFVIGCEVSREFVQAQRCRNGDLAQQRKRRVPTVEHFTDSRLAHSNAIRKRCLSDSVLRHPLVKDSESFCHMSADSIGMTYKGNSYLGGSHNSLMPRPPPPRSFLARAQEAFLEKYPAEKKATQTRLAQLAGVTQPSVAEWKEGVPQLENGMRLAKALGVCLEWLYTERGPKRPGATESVDKYLSPIIESWPDLDEETKRRIARYADFIRDDGK